MKFKRMKIPVLIFPKRHFQMLFFLLSVAVCIFTKMYSFVKWFLVICILVFVIYKHGMRKYNYWKKKGVKQLKPFPYIGDNRTAFFRQHDVIEFCQSLYKPFKSIGFGGLYVNQTPFLSVTNPDLLKQILVKDADCFMNRFDWFVSSDPLLSKNLANLKDETWKKMRAVMTTVFTSAKMKDMFGFMDLCAKQSVEYLEGKVAQHENNNTTEKTLHEIECRDFYSRYGTDVIGSTAFGIEVDSFKNPKNDFYMSGFAIRNLFSGWHFFKFIFINLFPVVSKQLGITVLGYKCNKFFTTLIENTIREREEKNIVRKDVIHILMESRKGKGVNDSGELVKGKLPDLTDLDIAAQAIVFFFGGFETMSTLLGFISYELAVNPEVQETLQREIDEVVEKENGITYDGVMHQMQYLNMVVNETLRKWPPAAVTDRAVTKPYIIPKTETSPELILNRDDNILVPISAFHYDPEYFPNPEKFDPERFRDEKNTIKPFTYLPFGEGLRHCVGMRYALMETKTILVNLLKRFTLVPSKKTQIPIKLSKKKPFALEPENGFWLALKPRV